MVRKVLFAGAAALSLLGAMPAFATDLISNGGFENTGDDFTGTTGYYNVGNPGTNADQGIPANFGWTVPVNNVDIVANGVFGTFLGTGGAYNLDLVGYGSTGAISQNLRTVMGQTYFVTLDYSSNSGITGPTAEITAGNADLGTITGTSGWQTFTTEFAANSTSTDFQITEGIGGGNAGVFLDNISVSAVPEPATWEMLLLGFGMVGFAMRTRRYRGTSVAHA